MLAKLRYYHRDQELNEKIKSLLEDAAEQRKNYQKLEEDFQRYVYNIS